MILKDLRDSIVKVLGFQGAEDLTVSGFDDVRDKLAGHSVAYEFDVEVDKKVIPFKLLGDASPIRQPETASGAAAAAEPEQHPRHRPAEHSGTLRAAARSSDEPLLSLRITGPSSLTSSTPASPNNKLKLKRLSPGLVQLSIPPASIEVWRESLWPLTSLNGSSPNLRGLDQLLVSVLGKKALQKGSFRLLRAEASAHTYVKMGFSVEKNLPPQADLPQLPPWKTRPQSAEAHFEVLARVDRAGNVVPERIQELPHPFHVADSVAHSVQAGNLSMTSLPLIYPPPTLFTL